MRASLISREVIADSIELMATRTTSTGSSAWSAATRPTPAALMALARVDKPAVVLYSGRCGPGRWRDRESDDPGRVGGGRRARSAG